MWITLRLIMLFPSLLNNCQNSHEKQLVSHLLFCVSELSSCPGARELTWCGVPAPVAQLVLLHLFTWDPQAAPPLEKIQKAFQVLCSSALAKFLFAKPATVLLLLKVCLDTLGWGAERFLPHCSNKLFLQINVIPVVTAEPLSLSWLGTRGISGLSLGGNGGLCVGSFPDPPWAEGGGRWAPCPGGVGRHGTLLPVPGALLEEGPGEQGEFYPQGLGNDREGCAQSLFANLCSCCGAEDPPAWRGFVPPHPAHTSGMLWVPHGEACLFFPHFLLWAKKSPLIPQLQLETRGQEPKVLVCSPSKHHRLRSWLRCHAEGLTNFSPFSEPEIASLIVLDGFFLFWFSICVNF